MYIFKRLVTDLLKGAAVLFILYCIGFFAGLGMNAADSACERPENEWIC